MRTERKNLKPSWPKNMVRKWRNKRNGVDEFCPEYLIKGVVDKNCERRKSFSDKDRYIVVPEEFPEGWLMGASNSIQRPRLEAVPPAQSTITDNLNLRMFVGTWNVAGKAPNEDLNLKDWLRTPSPADIYVLGFQEIVPLNAGNVLGPEDNGPAARWLSLIRQALYDNNSDPEIAQYYKNATDRARDQSPLSQPRLSFSDLMLMENEIWGDENSSETGSPDSKGRADSLRRKGHRYLLAVSKQMVGLFLCVWVRSDLYQHISNLKVSCVGRGIMGYLGNKGSISISMTLHSTTFCFVCTHLASGEKERDQVRRNSDVVEILKRTRFSQSRRGLRHEVPPESITDHDKVIWLGDLNYRLAPDCGDTRELLIKNDWKALLEKDQLKIEQRAGHVFEGWHEGRIYFAPTYKYLTNSDNYVVQTSIPKEKQKKEKQRKEKQRTPAWCDRILWKGEGLKQIWYVRGESKFSDHRPVYSLFSVLVNRKPNIRSFGQETIRHAASSLSLLAATNDISQTCSISKVETEELYDVNRAQSYIQSKSRF